MFPASAKPLESKTTFVGAACIHLPPTFLLAFCRTSPSQQYDLRHLCAKTSLYFTAPKLFDSKPEVDFCSHKDDWRCVRSVLSFLEEEINRFLLESCFFGKEIKAYFDKIWSWTRTEKMVIFSKRVIWRKRLKKRWFCSCLWVEEIWKNISTKLNLISCIHLFCTFS